MQPEPNDNLGGNVCKLCAEKIYAFYEFRLSYMESEKKLREMLVNFEINQRLTTSCSDSVSSLSIDDDSAQPKAEKDNDSSNLECRDCGRRFVRELELRIHSHTHRQIETPSQNNDSHNGFDDQFLIANIKSEPVEYDLDPMDWPETTQSDIDDNDIDVDLDMDMDNTSMLNDDDLRWKCTICQQRFLRRAHLRSHRRQHAQDRPSNERKKDTNKTIPHQKHDKHTVTIVKKKHNLNVTADAQFERWQCKKCFSTFRTRRMLRDHNVVHRNASAVSFEFDNSLNNSGNEPSIIHFDADSEADVAAATLAAAAIDMQSHVSPKKVVTSPKSQSTPLKSTETRWKCPKCRKVFETPKALRKHKLANHTFEIKLNLKSKNFISERKSVSFTSLLSSSSSKRKKLDANRSQFVERDWPCNSCHKVFNRRSLLREHRRTAHMLKPTGALPISLKQEQMDDFVADEYAVAD